MKTLMKTLLNLLRLTDTVWKMLSVVKQLLMDMMTGLVSKHNGLTITALSTLLHRKGYAFFHCFLISSSTFTHKGHFPSGPDREKTQ